MTADSGSRTLRCALLSTVASGWFTDLLFASPRLKLFALPEDMLELGSAHNPYGLPVLERPDAILLTVTWYAWLEQQGEAVVDRVFARLRQASDAIVALEGLDMFRLRMSPRGIERVDLVLKAQGLYRDPELYNYEVGPSYPGVNWTRKLRRATVQYAREHLEKLRLSLPCFVGTDRAVRARVRRVKAALSPLQRAVRNFGDWVSDIETAVRGSLLTRPTRTVHCTVYLSHIQRLELLVALKRLGVSGLLGVSQVPPHIFGTEHLEDPLPEERLAAVRATIAAHGLSHRPLDRNRFKRTMLQHKAVIAPTGYGEITFRHAEAWAQGRALICQDLSHVETMLPFRDRGNVIFCKPDFSDIGELLRGVEEGTIDWQRIGRQGQQDWQGWIAQRDGLFERGLLRHIEEAMAISRAPDEPFLAEAVG